LIHLCGIVAAGGCDVPTW